MRNDNRPVAVELGMVHMDLPFSDCKTWGATLTRDGVFQIVELDPAGPVNAIEAYELRNLARYLEKLADHYNGMQRTRKRTKR